MYSAVPRKAPSELSLSDPPTDRRVAADHILAGDVRAWSRMGECLVGVSAALVRSVARPCAGMSQNEVVMEHSNAGAVRTAQ